MENGVIRKKHISKMMKVLLSASAVFGAFTLSACSVNVTVNDPGATKDGTTEAEVTQEDIEKLIIGKWMTAERDGQPVPTNEKGVHDIISITKGYTSASIDTFNKRNINIQIV
jgi:hypothetical protein